MKTETVSQTEKTVLCHRMKDYTRCVAHILTDGSECASPFLVSDIYCGLTRSFPGQKVKLVSFSHVPFLQMVFKIQNDVVHVFSAAAEEHTDSGAIFYAGTSSRGSGGDTTGYIRFNAIQTLQNVSTLALSHASVVEGIINPVHEDWMRNWRKDIPQKKKILDDVHRDASSDFSPLFRFLSDASFVSAICTAVSTNALLKSV